MSSGGVKVGVGGIAVAVGCNVGSDTAAGCCGSVGLVAGAGIDVAVGTGASVAVGSGVEQASTSIQMAPQRDRARMSLLKA